MAENAYVEISAAEATKIIADTETQFSREDFLEAIEKFTEKNEFRVNPDKEKVNMLIDGIFNNEQNHGLKYCPCRLIAKDFIEDLKLVCPCNFRIHETYKDKQEGECWCGLFVRRK